MREGTRLWKQSNKRVLELLNRLDPYGLEPGRHGGVPLDEYDLEAESIARHLIKEGSIDMPTVDEIWRYWFEQTLTEAVGPAVAKQFVASLNALSASSTEQRDMP